MPTLSDCLGKIKTGEKESRFWNSAYAKKLLDAPDPAKALNDMLNEANTLLSVVAPSGESAMKAALKSIYPCIIKNG